MSITACLVWLQHLFFSSHLRTEMLQYKEHEQGEE